MDNNCAIFWTFTHSHSCTHVQCSSGCDLTLRLSCLKSEQVKNAAVAKHCGAAGLEDQVCTRDLQLWGLWPKNTGFQFSVWSSWAEESRTVKSVKLYLNVWSVSHQRKFDLGWMHSESTKLSRSPSGVCLCVQWNIWCQTRKHVWMIILYKVQLLLKQLNFK